MKAVKTILCAAAVMAAGVLAAQEVQTYDKVADWNKHKQIAEEDGLVTVKGSAMMTAKLFDVDPAKTYTIKLSARAKNFKEKDGSLVYVGFQAFDAKGYQIFCEQVNVVDGTFTEVTADAAKGATTFFVKDGSKFKKGAFIVVKNAKGDFSDLPNRTPVSKGRVVNVAKVDGAWEIALNAPLAVDLKAGEKIREHAQGGYLYVGGWKTVVGDWVEFTGSISGLSKKGFSAKVWPVGTAKARLLILSDWGKKDLSTQYKDVTVTVK